MKTIEKQQLQFIVLDIFHAHQTVFKTCRVATLPQMDCILVTTQSTLQHKPCRLQGSRIEPLTPWVGGATASSHHCVRLLLDGQNNTFEDVLSSPLGNGKGHYFLKMYRKTHYLSNQGNKLLDATLIPPIFIHVLTNCPPSKKSGRGAPDKHPSSLQNNVLCPVAISKNKDTQTNVMIVLQLIQ